VVFWDNINVKLPQSSYSNAQRNAYSPYCIALDSLEVGVLGHFVKKEALEVSKTDTSFFAPKTLVVAFSSNFYFLSSGKKIPPNARRYSLFPDDVICFCFIFNR
jgi:hypothetical protein